MDARHSEEISVDPASAAPTNVIFGNGLRQLGVREENNPVEGRARSLIYS